MNDNVIYLHNRTREPYLQTYSGGRFFPLDVKRSDIAIVDIAHALSNQCRYGGHCTRFYSVAEHSLLISRELTRRGYSATVAMAGLLHDAAEAYLVDLPSPVKKLMPAYCALEKQVLDHVFHAYYMPMEIPDIVHEYDNRILLDERAQNMCYVYYGYGWPENVSPLNVDLELYAPAEAAKEFMLRFAALQVARRKSGELAL